MYRRWPIHDCNRLNYRILWTCFNKESCVHQLMQRLGLCSHFEKKRWRCNSLALLSVSFELAVYSLILLFFIIIMKIDPCGLFGKNTNTKYQATTGQDSREKRCHRYTKREPLVELTFPEECRHVSSTVRWIHMHRMDRRSRCHSLSTGDIHTVGWTFQPKCPRLPIWDSSNTTNQNTMNTILPPCHRTCHNFV
jgi:hypothetical protein